MPQLDIVTFFNQAFWVVSVFSFFYMVMLKKYLPLISTALKVRTKFLFFKVNSSSNISEEIQNTVKKQNMLLDNFFNFSRLTLLSFDNFSQNWLKQQSSSLLKAEDSRNVFTLINTLQSRNLYLNKLCKAV